MEKYLRNWDRLVSSDLSLSPHRNRQQIPPGSPIEQVQRGSLLLGRYSGSTFWIMTHSKTHILHGSREIILMNLCAGQRWRCRRYGEQTCGHSGGRSGQDELREWHQNIYINICKTDSQWESDSGSSNPVLCDHLAGQDGVGGGRKVQGVGGHVYTYG